MFGAYRDRVQAGRELAESLRDLADRPDASVLGLPRGGVPVAAEVAAVLHAPLDVMVVRKVGVPGHEELAMGAVAGGGAYVLNDALVQQLNISPETIHQATERERRAVEQRERLYRGDREPIDLTGRCVILVDDGIATGASMRAAVQMARQLGAREVVVAVPVAPPQSVAELSRHADRVVCPRTPLHFFAVGQWYEDFEQVTDDEVRRILTQRHLQRSGPSS